jgi:hypothetical protein
MAIGTAMYRQQHEDLRALAAELAARLGPAELAADPAAARTILSRMAGKLTVHLAMEDRSLYPFLLSRPDAALHEVARRFRDGMGGVRAALARLTGRWRGSADIARDPAAFAAEAAALLRALEDRIRHEEEELFPLAERCP